MLIDNTPRCRLCGYSLKATSGCEVCLALKENCLIWPAVEDAESDFSAATVVRSTLRTLQSRLKALRREIQVQDGYNPTHTKDLTGISRALKELAAEQRKLEDREDKHYAKLGIEGKMNLFIEQFFNLLPEDYQVKMLESMRDAYKEQNEPMLLPENND